MDGRFALMAVILLGAFLISGCTEPLDRDSRAVMDSTGRWLGTEQGRSYFPNGVVGEPVRVWREGETLYWIATIKNQEGLYIGNLIVTQEDFTSPKQIVRYKEPRERILNYTQSEAYQQMIMESGYPAWQIEEPVLISVEGEGLYWYSRVKAGNEVIDELYLKTFTIF